MNTIVYVHIMYKFIFANFFLIVCLQLVNIHMYVEMLVKFRYTKSTFLKIDNNNFISCLWLIFSYFANHIISYYTVSYGTPCMCIYILSHRSSMEAPCHELLASGIGTPCGYNDPLVYSACTPANQSIGRFNWLMPRELAPVAFTGCFLIKCCSNGDPSNGKFARFDSWSHVTNWRACCRIAAGLIDLLRCYGYCMAK